MVDVGAPEVAPVLDAQAVELVVDVVQVVDALFPGALAHAHHQLALVVEVHVGVIGGHVGEERGDVVVVEVLVHPVAEEEAGAIDAGKRDAALEEVRATEGGDGGVRGAHAAANSERTEVGVVPGVDARDELVGHELEVLLLAPGAGALVAALVAPALLVEVVDGEHLDASLLDEGGQDVDHAEVLEVVALGVLGLEGDDGVAALTVDDHGHVLVQHVAVLVIVLALHCQPLPMQEVVICRCRVYAVGQFTQSRTFAQFKWGETMKRAGRDLF